MRVTLLSGGVGGARLARGLAAVAGQQLAVIVNVGDDEELYGLSVSPDLDTVLYTLAAKEGPEGWGIAGDTFVVMGQLSSLGEDTRFRIGDRDLATNLFRTRALRDGIPLSSVTAQLAEAFGIRSQVMPVTDDRLRTRVLNEEGEWLGFQEYFVLRRHEDRVLDLRFEGARQAKPAPGVIQALEDAELVIIGPSNPPLSIWPILAVRGISEAVAAAPRVIAVSPLFGGKALKGPADRVLGSLGFPSGNRGVAAAYDGLVHELVIDRGDASDRPDLEAEGLVVHVTDTRLGGLPVAQAFARWLLELE